MRVEISLTAAQAANLRGLLDVAVKAGGLQVAAAALEIDGLVLEAAKRAESAAAEIKPAGESGDAAG